MAIITTKFKPNQGGPEFDVPNVQTVDWGAQRNSNESGHIAVRGFDVGTVRLSRLKSLQEEGVAEPEDETINLAAATDKKAYFSGEITVAPPDDEANIIQTVRWDNGYISGIQCSINEYGITESLEITVTNLTVDDSVFEQRKK